MGENAKTLRRLEHRYRDVLRSHSPLYDLLFDRFWVSYLRLLLSARLEARLIGGKPAGKSESLSVSLVPGNQPTLVYQGSSEASLSSEELPADLLQGLVLVQRYDRHYSREMYRTLALLLLLRRGGDAALESWATEMLGGLQQREKV
jgi:hypothetical protein